MLLLVVLCCNGLPENGVRRRVCSGRGVSAGKLMEPRGGTAAGVRELVEAFPLKHAKHAPARS